MNIITNKLPRLFRDGSALTTYGNVTDDALSLQTAYVRQ
jgi:hypothetical protein